MSTTHRVFIVYNPVSGTGRADELHEIFDQYFTAPEWSYTMYGTTGQESLSQVIRQAAADGFNFFVVAGGDGTIAGVAGGLVNSPHPLGIIPAGTSNVFARELNLPLDFYEALELLVGEHQYKGVDAMQIGDDYFFANVSIGPSADIIKETSRTVKNWVGQLAYLRPILRQLVGAQPHRYLLTVDDRRIRAKALSIIVINAGVIGPTPFRWGAHVHVDDGQVDVAIMRNKTWLDHARSLWHIAQGEAKKDPNITYLEARRLVRIEAKRRLTVQADGEIIGHPPLDIHIIPQAVQVITPRLS